MQLSDLAAHKLPYLRQSGWIVGKEIALHALILFHNNRPVEDEAVDSAASDVQFVGKFRDRQIASLMPWPGFVRET
jgi:hypothetical protein